MISLKIDQEQLRRLEGMVDEDDTREKARLGSLSLPHAGDWLNCAPIKSLGLHLRPSEFVLAVKYRLGLPIYDAEGPCPVGRVENGKNENLIFSSERENKESFLLEIFRDRDSCQ